MDAETSNALWGLGLAIFIVASWLAVMAFRRTKRKPMATPVPDSRCSITQFRKIHTP